MIREHAPITRHTTRAASILLAAITAVLLYAGMRWLDDGGLFQAAAAIRGEW